MPFGNFDAAKLAAKLAAGLARPRKQHVAIPGRCSSTGTALLRVDSVTHYAIYAQGYASSSRPPQRTQAAGGDSSNSVEF